MAIVGGVAGGKLALPVQRQPHDLELRAHGGDVVIGPAFGVDAFFHCGVFSRHPEGVPAHGVQNSKAAGALVAGHNVAHGIVAHVPHVNAPGRIGKHFQHVVFGARVGPGGCRKNALRVPRGLPFGFSGFGVVAVRRCGGCVGRGSSHLCRLGLGADTK